MYLERFFLGFFAIWVLWSCTKNADSPGLEYMPDMYRSPAIEAYVDYGVVAGKEIDSLTSKLSVRSSVSGTIPFSFDIEKTAYNFPLEYAAPDKDPQAYERVKELKNPIPYSLKIEEEGKLIYTRFCVSCHGVTGQGDGKVVEWGNFPTPGSYNTKFKDVTEGQMFYSITYGKGLMGAHAAQLSKEERWKVVHYVRALQNGGQHPQASEVKN